MTNDHAAKIKAAALRRIVARSILVEEIQLDARARGAELIRHTGGHERAARIETAIRAQRVAIIKQRAILGANGIRV